MQISATDQAFWLGGSLSQVALIWVLIRQREYKRFPVFVFWILVLIILDPLLFWCSVRLSSYSYYRAYTVTGVLDFSLQICVLIEIALTVLKPAQSRISNGTLRVLGVGVLAFFLTALVWVLGQSAQTNRVFIAYTRLQHVVFVVAYLRLGVFSAIAAFSQMLGITWRNHVIRLAGGLAFYSGVSLIVQLTVSHLSQRNWENYTKDYWLLNHTQVIAYLMALTFWVWSFVQKDAPRREFTPQMQKILVTISQAARRDRVGLSRSMEHK